MELTYILCEVSGAATVHDRASCSTKISTTYPDIINMTTSDKILMIKLILMRIQVRGLLLHRILLPTSTALTSRFATRCRMLLQPQNPTEHPIQKEDQIVQRKDSVPPPAILPARPQPLPTAKLRPRQKLPSTALTERLRESTDVFLPVRHMFLRL